MSSRDVLRKILSVAVQAPSGDNAQPWRFALSDDTLRIFNVPGGDATLYNFRQRGSYFAHGALAENICIAALAQGFEVSIEPFPGQPNCTATMAFRPTSPAHNHLHDAIGKRVTNRKPYDKKPLDPGHVEALKTAASGDFGARLELVHERAAIESLARAISANERILMENRQLHDFLFNMIRWSEQEEFERPGLFVKTMEFPKPVQLLMRFVVRHWGAVQLLNKVGLSKAIRKQSAAVYGASSALGALVIRGERDEDFFNAGRAFERVWLTATNLGMRVQPVTALPYLMQRVRARETESLSPEHIALIWRECRTIESALGVSDNEHIAMFCGRG